MFRRHTAVVDDCFFHRRVAHCLHALGQWQVCNFTQVRAFAHKHVIRTQAGHDRYCTRCNLRPQLCAVCVFSRHGIEHVAPVIDVFCNLHRSECDGAAALARHIGKHHYFFHWLCFFATECFKCANGAGRNCFKNTLAHCVGNSNEFFFCSKSSWYW